MQHITVFSEKFVQIIILSIKGSDISDKKYTGWIFFSCRNGCSYAV